MAFSISRERHGKNDDFIKARGLGATSMGEDWDLFDFWKLFQSEAFATAFSEVLKTAIVRE